MNRPRIAPAGRRRLPPFVLPEAHLTRDEVANAFGVPPRAFANWSLRQQLHLDADQGRASGSWRRYTPSDVLKIGCALALTRAGLPASLLAGAIARIVAFAEAGEDRPDSLAVMPDGEVVAMDQIEARSGPASAFICLRLADVLAALPTALVTLPARGREPA